MAPMLPNFSTEPRAKGYWSDRIVVFERPPVKALSVLSFRALARPAWDSSFSTNLVDAVAASNSAGDPAREQTNLKNPVPGN